MGNSGEQIRKGIVPGNEKKEKIAWKTNAGKIKTNDKKYGKGFLFL